MIDHLLIYTTPDLHKKTLDFYLATLAPIGYKKMQSIMDDQVVGFGDGSRHPDFWIACTSIKPGENIQPGYAHFAFSAKGQKLVDECYAKGLEAGGKDNGAPGPRPMYGPTYYGGFLFDPMGNGMEFVNRED